MKYCMSIQYPNPNDWIQRLFCFCGVCWAVGNCQAEFQIESGSSLWLLVPRSRTQWWVIVKMWAPIWDSPDWLTALYSCPIDTVPSYNTLSFINGPPPAPCNVLSLSSSSCLDWPAATLSPALSLLLWIHFHDLRWVVGYFQSHFRTGALQICRIIVPHTAIFTPNQGDERYNAKFLWTKQKHVWLEYGLVIEGNIFPEKQK